VVNALQLKNDQNRDVIDRLAAEKRELEGRAHTLERQIQHPGVSKPSRFAVVGYDLEVDEEGVVGRRPLGRPKSAPSSPTRPATRLLTSASCEMGGEGAPDTDTDPEGLHWEIHVDPTTAEVYYYNTKTGQVQAEAGGESKGARVATRSTSTERSNKVFEISSQLQVDLLKFKQRQIEIKMREDKSRLEQKKHEDLVSDRYLKVRAAGCVSDLIFCASVGIRRLTLLLWVEMLKMHWC
jgi:hypothetical protein